MAYSNGYNLTSVLPALFGRLGWSTGSGLNTANKTSNSGRRFEDFHAAVTVDIVKAITPNQADYDVYFTNKQNAVIAKALNAVFNQPEYKQQVNLYTPCGEEQFVAEANTGKAVGYKINLIDRFDIACQINSLELYFDSAKTFNVYLFKQGSKTAVKTQSVTTVANQKTTVALTDWILRYKDSPVWYIAYFQDDLAGGKALREEVEEAETFHFGHRPFMAETTGTDFVRNALSYFDDLAFGLNMQISSFKDYTQNILNQPHLFDELIGLFMAATVLEEIIYSTESSAKERILKGQITDLGLQLDLKGQAAISDGPKVTGLEQKINSAVKVLKEAFYPKAKAQTINVGN